MYYLTFGVSLALSMLLVPIIRRSSSRFGRVVQPRQDRWHTKPTPVLGGVGIFFAFISSVLLTSGNQEIRWGLLAGSVIIFLVGVYDDIKPLTPPTKLLGQIIAAGVVVFSGYTTRFFSTPLPNILITFIWLVGITNAINLLDNMDGLAAGISFIAAGVISFFLWQNADQELLVLSLSLAGASLGFLIFNFPPASIFMGDSGSLFLGFTLASLAIARTPQASNVLSVMSVPTLIFLLPILDTTLVTFTRLLSGQSPAQGGRDHASHRLVAFGLSERQTVLILYAIAIASGVVGATIESLDYSLSLVLIPMILVAFALLAAYLGRLRVIDRSRRDIDIVPKDLRNQRPLTNFMVELTYKRRILEIALDFFLISISYYLAFWIRFGFTLNQSNTNLLIRALPVAIGSAYVSFSIFGVYRGVWQYIGIADLTRFTRATLGTAGLSIVGLYVYAPEAFSLGTMFMFSIFLLLGLTASRSSFRVLDLIFGLQVRTQIEETRILLYGAGDIGEIALRWIMQNPQLGYRVVGILDNDPYKQGRSIHGIDILGGLDHLERFLGEREVQGVVISSAELPEDENKNFEKAIETCRERGIWVRKLRLEFELLA